MSTYGDMTLNNLGALTLDTFGELTMGTPPVCPWTAATVASLQAALAAIQADIAEIKTKVNALPTATYTVPTVEQIQSGLATSQNVTDAQNAITASCATATGFVTSVPSAETIASSVWGATTRTLTASPTDISSLATSSQITSLQSHGDSSWATASSSTIADAVCDELLSGHTTAGSLAAVVSGINTTATSLPSSTAAAVWAQSATGTTAGTLGAKLVSLENYSGSNIPTASQIAQAVWQEDSSATFSDNTFGQKVTSIPTVASIVTGVWDSTASEHNTSGTLGGTLAATATATSAAAIQSACSTIADYTDTLEGNMASIGANVLLIKDYTDTLEESITELPTAASVASAVWESATRTLTSSSSGGATAQEVWEYAARTLTSASDTSGITTLTTKVDAIQGDVTAIKTLDTTIASDVSSIKTGSVTVSAQLADAAYDAIAVSVLTQDITELDTTATKYDLENLVRASLLHSVSNNHSSAGDTLSTLKSDGTVKNTYTITTNPRGELTSIE